MKDEIKDLKCLGALGNLQSFAIDGTKGSKIVDINVNIVKNCITNLQEELEEQKRIEQASLDTITNLQEEYKHLSQSYYDRHEAYYKLKSRNEKAISMLKELNIKLKDILKIGIDIKEISDIENILQGSDKE